MRKPLFPKQPLTSVPGDPAPGNSGQLNATLKGAIELLPNDNLNPTLSAGVEMLSKNRPDITPILKAARAAKEAT